MEKGWVQIPPHPVAHPVMLLVPEMMRLDINVETLNVIHKDKRDESDALYT